MLKWAAFVCQASLGLAEAGLECEKMVVNVCKYS